MPKNTVELGDLSARFGDDPGMYREFTAQVKRAGTFAGELMGNTSLIRVTFSSEAGLEAVDVEKGDPYSGDPVKYLDKIKDDRKARKIVSSAVDTALYRLQPQTIEDLPPLGLGMEK
jgi:hypothetical protein